MAKQLHCDRFLPCICMLVVCAISLASGQQLPDAPKSDTLQNVRNLLDAGQLAESEKILRSYLYDHLQSADAHFLLGYTLFREERPKDSLAEFTEGAKFQRPQMSDLKIVAADYVVLGDFSDADKWLTLVTNESPQDADAWYLLGRAKYNENRFQEAIQSFQRTLAMRPKDVKAEDNLGLSYQGLNRLDDARKTFEAAISWQNDSPVKDAQPYLNLGILLVDQDQPSQAVSYLQQAAALAPHNPKVREQLGRAYNVLNMPDKAQRELEQAVALAPEASGLHFMLGQSIVV
ncbi:MAG TPA: tetratricopeptide repeat protein, partial [Ktedonobacteraceae bacterium]